MARKNSSAAKAIGKGLAHVQHSVDHAFGWAFKKLKKVNIGKSEKDPLKKKIKERVNGAAHFLGDVGAHFYREYEKLKQKNKKTP